MRSSRRSRALVAAMEAEREALERKGAAASARIGLEVRARVIRAYAMGMEDPVHAYMAALASMVPLVSDGMLAAHLQGRARALENAGLVGAEPVQLDRAYDATIDLLRERLSVPQSSLAALRKKYDTEAVHVVSAFGGKTGDGISRAVESITKRGLHVKAGTAELKKAFDRAGIVPGNKGTLETVYRTQTSVAFHAGRVNAAEDPDIAEIQWGWEYVTVGDDRVRPEHAALDGFRAPMNDASWKRIMPPNGYNCRCSVVEIFKGDILAKKTPYPKSFVDDGSGKRVVPGPDKGWAFNPGKVYADDVAPIASASAGPTTMSALSPMGGTISAIDAAEHVLREMGTGMTPKALIAEMERRGLWKSPGGKTPDASLYAAISREIKADGNNARFVKVGPGQFAIAKKAKTPPARIKRAAPPPAPTTTTKHDTTTMHGRFDARVEQVRQIRESIVKRTPGDPRLPRPAELKRMSRELHRALKPKSPASSFAITTMTVPGDSIRTDDDSTIGSVREWIREHVSKNSVSKKPIEVAVAPPGVKAERAFATPNGGRGGAHRIIAFRKDTRATYVHEIGHCIEFDSPFALNKCKKWLEKRRGKERLRKLNTLNGRGGYDDDEVAFLDDLIDAYIGKHYAEGDATEVLSMGLEMYFTNAAEFAAKDPEMFDLVVALITD